MSLTSILGEDYWDRDGGTGELRLGKCQLSPVQLQLLAFDMHHLLLEGSLSLQLALYPPQHHQFLPLETHQRLAAGAGCYGGPPC